MVNPRIFGRNRRGGKCLSIPSIADERVKITLHPYLVHYFDSSQPASLAGRPVSTLWPAGRFRVIWPAGRFGVIWPAGRFRVIWPAGRFGKSGRPQGSVQNGLLRYILYTCPKPVMTFVFKVLRTGLLRYILYTCPDLWWRSCSKCYGTHCFGTYFAHVQTCDDVRVQSATQWTASVHTLHMSKPVITFVSKVLRNGLLRYILYTCPNQW